MKITYYGHSALGLEIGNTHIIVDPFISANPAANLVDLDNLKADYILLTHAHYDHIYDVERIVNRTKAKIIANHEIVTWYNTHKQYEGIAMNQGGSMNFDFGVLKAVTAIHSSSFPDGSYGGNPLGFIVRADGKSIYIAGDTALTMDMKIIPMFDKLDLAILPMGSVFTMDVEEAVVASEWIECNSIMGVHYDTMPLIAIDHDSSKQKFAEKGKKLTLLNIGESIQM
ncbi:MAG: metal-dependent hydrolase [Brumimicrobium sp.]|nr:metal-dependent hydrolase [Brumimicrobium sp.]MCO5267639.1 metal-dependent hydrolase [Brumimicrobium sp.]